jgi:hypothetical protein
MSDTIRALQSAAHLAADLVSPGEWAARVLVFSAAGVKILGVAVPASVTPIAPAAPKPAEPEPVAGWLITPTSAFSDGRRVAVASSRLKLLKVLVEADGPLTGKQLLGLAFDAHASEENCRFHVGQLRKELKATFAGEFDGDILPNEGDGYRLGLR